MRTAISHRSRHRRPARRRFPASRPGARRTSHRPSYLGPRLRRPLFLPARTQQVKTLSRAAAWTGGGAMLLAMASWGILVALLAV